MSRIIYPYIKAVDKHIGDMVYSLRLAKGLSLKQLAEKIKVSHQQLAKYEKGGDRISVGRLILIAQALEIPVNYFYEGLDYKEYKPTLTQHQRMCLEVSRNFMKISCPKHQEAVSVLVSALLSSQRDIVN
jgi:transcriptional regulator with XRE-family HTH domain